MKSIYVTIPNGDGWIHRMVSRVSTLLCNDSRYEVRLEFPRHKPYVNNLHHCCRSFLDSDAEFWVTIDADNPPTRNPLDLVELDLDVVGCPTPIWHNDGRGLPFAFNAMSWDESEKAYREHSIRNGLQDVDAVGSGCLLIARRVIEALKDQKPFMRVWNKDGTVEFSGDFAFCQKAKRAGFNIWTHYDYPCHHFCELDLLEVIQCFGEVLHGG